MYITPKLTYCHLDTVKHGYREHAYNKLTLTAKRFSFPRTLLHVVKLTDRTNYAYNEAKSPVPGTSYLACFTVKCFHWCSHSFIFLYFMYILCIIYIFDCLIAFLVYTGWPRTTQWSLRILLNLVNTVKRDSSSNVFFFTMKKFIEEQ